MSRHAYPSWCYFPRNRREAGWVPPLLGVIAGAEASISTQRGNGLDSDGVLRELAAGLDGLGYQVELSKATTHKITRPVLFRARVAPPFRWMSMRSTTAAVSR